MRKPNINSCFPVIENHRCVGCGFCAAVCSRHCLVIKKDAAGFSAAVIADANSCVNCGRCLQVCPEIREVKPPRKLPKAYALWHKDPDIVMQSSSGGAFTALAESVINSGGYVAGVKMHSNEAVYALTNSLSELASMRGSKYLPADIFPIVAEVESKLKEGSAVLATVLPCAAAALKKYFSRKNLPGKLYIVDMICSGVPAPAYFAREMADKKVYVDTFRKKGPGNPWKKSQGLWGKDIDSGEERYIPISKTYFYNAFASGQILRSSCYECSHANLDRFSDLTIADFWGEGAFPEQHEKGVSLAVVNSESGRELLELASSELVMHESSVISAARKNPRLCCGIEPRRDYFLRKKFVSLYGKLPFGMLKILYSGGFKHFIFGKLFYRLLWRKNARHRKAILKQQQQALDELINISQEQR